VTRLEESIGVLIWITIVSIAVNTAFLCFLMLAFIAFLVDRLI
jgi:hypothetical protein